MLWQMLLSSLCPAATSSFWTLLLLQLGKVFPQPSPQTEADSWGQLQSRESSLAYPKGQGNPVFPVRWKVQRLQIKQNWEDKSLNLIRVPQKETCKLGIIWVHFPGSEGDLERGVPNEGGVEHLRCATIDFLSSTEPARHTKMALESYPTSWLQIHFKTCE